MNAVTYDNIWYVKREKKREFKSLIHNLLSNFIAMNFIFSRFQTCKNTKIIDRKSKRTLRK